MHSNNLHADAGAHHVGGRFAVLPAANKMLSIVHVGAAYILVVTVFCFDVVVPLGEGISFFYLVPVAFLALWSSPKQSLAVMGIAGASSVLIALGFLLSPPGALWHAVTNRCYALIVIGVTVMLSIVRKRAEEDVKMLRGLLPICSYCKKIRDDEGYWQQVERYIAARSEADFSHGMCPECAPKHFPDLYPEEATQSLKPRALGFFSKPGA